MKFSDSANRLQGQPMFKLLDRVHDLEKKGKDFIHFEIGDPNFDTPLSVKMAAIDAINQGLTHYTSSSGLPELKEAIVKFYKDFFNAAFSPKNVVIGPGCNPLIHAVIECLVNEGENVVLTDPCFPTYPSVLNFLGVEVKYIPLWEKNLFCPSLEDVKAIVNNKTKIIVLNSPNNPTGSVMDPCEILEIVQFAKKRDIIVICDEIYNLLNYTPILFSAAEFLNKYDNVVMLSGFSKAFAMSGWRVGYMVADAGLCEKVSLLLQTTVSCTNTFIQKACCKALFNSHAELHDMKHEYMRRRNYLIERLNNMKGIKCNFPMGAFYAFPNVSGTEMDGELFAEKMLDHGVVVLPGNSFGPTSKYNIRICFTRPMAEIQEGLNRIERGLQT